MAPDPARLLDDDALFNLLGDDALAVAVFDLLFHMAHDIAVTRLGVGGHGGREKRRGEKGCEDAFHDENLSLLTLMSLRPTP